MGRLARKLSGSACVVTVLSLGEKWVFQDESTWRRQLEDKRTAELLVCLHNPRTDGERQWISENQERSRVQGNAAAKRPAVGALNQESTVGGLVLRLAQPELSGLVCREKPEAE